MNSLPGILGKPGEDRNEKRYNSMKSTTTRLTIQGLEIELVRKSIKNLHIRVYQPDGRVTVSSPRNLPNAEIHRAVVNRMAWIREQQNRFRAAPAPWVPQFVTGETHFVWGVERQLDLVERPGRALVELKDGRLCLSFPPGSDATKRQRVLEDWYRQQLKDVMPDVVAKWEQRLNAPVAEWRIRRMKTLWGSCSIRARRIWLSLELAKKHPHCLDYVVAHEIAHLLQRNHGPAFDAIMTSVLPEWRDRQRLLETPTPASPASLRPTLFNPHIRQESGSSYKWFVT